MAKNYLKNFFQFLCETWENIAPAVICNGFKKAGIVPLNENVIPEESFPPDLLKKWKEASLLKESEPGSSKKIDSASKEPEAGSSKETEAGSSKETEASLSKEIAAGSSRTVTPMSFEYLLLSAVKQTPRPQFQKKNRICPGSEILTSTQAMDVLNKKIKSAKKVQNRTTHLSSSSSEDRSSPPLQDSDNTDEFLNEILDDDIAQKKYVNENVETSLGCWVLVKYCTKKILKHFVGNVIEKTDGGWVVKFSKPYKNKFVWPKFEDTDTIEEENIITVLPEPLVDRRGLFQFSVRFSGYNL